MDKTFSPDPNSIVDFLTSQGKDSSLQSRANLYQEQGLGSSADYLSKGTNNAAENTALLNALRKPSPTVITANNARNNYNAIVDNVNTMSSNPAQRNTIFSNGGNGGDTEDQNFYSLMDNISNSSQLTPSDQAQLSRIRSEYDATKRLRSENDMRYLSGLDVAGLRTGRTQYAPEMQMQIVNNAKQNQLSKLEEIDMKANRAIQDAQDAIIDKKVTSAKEAYKAYQDYQKQKRDETYKMLNYQLAEKRLAQQIAYQNAQLGLSRDRLALAQSSGSGSGDGLPDNGKPLGGQLPPIPGLDTGGTDENSLGFFRKLGMLGNDIFNNPDEMQGKYGEQDYSIYQDWLGLDNNNNGDELNIDLGLD